MQINGATQSADSSLAIFAHELRQPLASILFAVQSVGETISDDSTAREMWGIVERQSRYLSRIIDGVMELGRGSHGKLTLSRDRLDLGTMVTNAVEAVKPLLIQRRHQLMVLLPPEPVCVMADALRMQQVMINLLTNAAKYTDCGGQIIVGLERINELAVIEVSDNGVGISPELLPRVFDLFRQGGKTCAGKASGLGIGLALVKSLVELHGGSISAHSGGVGAGSTFVILLPQARAEEGCRQHAEAPETRAEPVWINSAMLDA